MLKQHVADKIMKMFCLLHVNGTSLHIM